MNLPDLYNRVNAKRPDLAVPCLEHKPCWCGCGPRWILSRHLGSTDYLEDVDAAALILARWVEALPVNHHLSYDMNDGKQRVWRVFRLREASSRFEACPDRTTPLEALAAFYLGATA